MSPQSLASAIERLYGKRGGSAFCREYGINRSTLYRWQDGRCPIPHWVAKVLEIKGE